MIADYNNEFLIQLDDNNNYVSMDINHLKACFEEKGYELVVTNYSKLDLERDYNNAYILYQTSEANGQFYKKYIEDMICHFEKLGAVPMPCYEYLKAHHNKGYMELLKSRFVDEELKTIKSKYFGTMGEALIYTPEYPVVIKKISGAGSIGVYLAKNEREYTHYVKEATKTIIGEHLFQVVERASKEWVKKIFSSMLKPQNKNQSIHTDRPIVVQNFVSNLQGDYKVLYYGGKYYTLYRKNRDDDFRASGSGKLCEVPIEENDALLDFAEKIKQEIDFPIIGMDIGHDGNKFHLLEFQMIHLGPYALMKSDYYFVRDQGKWKSIQEKSDLSTEFARSICAYIESKKHLAVEVDN